MPVFNNAAELIAHINRTRAGAVKTVRTDDVTYTAKVSGYPNNTPNVRKNTSTTTSLFDKTITDIMRKEKYERGIGGAIVDKIIDDAMKNGFTIDKTGTQENPDRELTRKLTRIYREKVFLELDKALKRARLYGYSFLLLGYKDGGDLSKPVQNKSAKLEYIKALSRTWVSNIAYKTNGDGFRGIPEELDHIDLQPGAFSKGSSVDASRLIMVINNGLDEDAVVGCSVLDRPFNIITVIDHMLWSAGQTMWRVGGGLLGIGMPPDATPEDRDEALDSMGDINAKTVLAFPDGYKANVLNMASAALNPQPYFESAIVQLAGVSEYPKSILYGLATGAVTGSQLDRSTYYSKVVVKQTWISRFLVKILEGFEGTDLKDPWELNWNSPYELTEKERKDIEKVQSEIDHNRIISYIETPDEVRERDGRGKLTTEQKTLLSFIQTKGSSTTSAGTGAGTGPFIKEDPRKAKTTIVHQSADGIYDNDDTNETAKATIK